MGELGLRTGERDVLSQARLEEEPLTRPPQSWVGRFVEVVTRRPRSEEEKAEYARQTEELIAAVPEKMDPKELEVAPAFQYRTGFNSPQDHYKTGEQPVTAPISKEEMNLILFGSIPEKLLPLVMNHFEFSYSEDDFIRDENDRGGSDESRGTNIEIAEATDQFGIKRKKVHINFHFDSFFNHLIPPRARPHHEGLIDKGRWMSGIIDPSKVNLILGKILAHLIKPPWSEEDPSWQKLVPPGFKVTTSRGGSEIVTPEKMWEDFVALAVANPDQAQKDMPELYQYYQKAIADFTQVDVQDAALDRLENDWQEGKIDLHDFNIVYDIRSQEEKREAEEGRGDTAQLAWYDRVATWLNRFPLKLFGKRITFELPEDPERVYQREKDKGEIAKLLEQYRCVDRDHMFGDTLQRGHYAKGMAKLQLRTKARQLLIANSQSADFTEWRVISYLHVFSEKFRETGGYEISKEDYEDLRTVHNTSAGAAKRHGTDMMMYKTVPIKDPNSPGLRYRYMLKPRAEYIESIRSKIAEKSDDLMNKMPVDGLDQCTNSKGRIVDFDGSFSRFTQDGMETVYGNLRDDDMLGAHLADELAQLYLEPWRISLISPDTQEVLRRFNEYVIRKGGPDKVDKATSDQFKQFVAVYGNELVRPASEQLKKVTKINPATLIRTNNVPMIADQMKKINDVCTTSLGSLEQQLQAKDTKGNRVFNLHPKTERHLLSALRHGPIKSDELIKVLLQEAWQKYIFDTRDLEQEQASLEFFFYNGTTSEVIRILNEASEYQRALEPAFAKPIEATVNDFDRYTDQWLTTGDDGQQAQLPLLKEVGLLKEEDLDKKLTETLQTESLEAALTFLENIEDIKEKREKAGKIAEGFREYLAEKQKGRFKNDPDEEQRWMATSAKHIRIAQTGEEEPDVSEGFIEDVRQVIQGVEGAVKRAKQEYVKDKTAKATEEQRIKIVNQSIETALFTGAETATSLLYHLDPTNEKLGLYQPGDSSFFSGRFQIWLAGPGRLFTLPPLEIAITQRLQAAVRLMDRDPRAGAQMIEEIISKVRQSFDYEVAQRKAEAPAETKK